MAMGDSICILYLLLSMGLKQSRDTLPCWPHPVSDGALWEIIISSSKPYWLFLFTCFPNSIQP